MSATINDLGPVSATTAGSWRAGGAFLRSLGRLAPAVYLVTALPTVIFLTTLTPPFQAPDETNHFRRAVQILRGEIVGHDIEAPGWSGAQVPKNVGEVAESFSYLIGQPEKKFSAEIMRNTRKIPWNWTDREFNSFANTVIYPPLFYLPAVGTLAAARDLGWGVLDSYLLARLTTGIVAVLIATLAIGLAVNGRALLFVLLSLPMSLYLFASISQDALLIASTALAMSLCSRAAGQDRALNVVERVIVAVLLGGAVAARPPYIFLLSVLLTPIVRSEVRGRTAIWARVRPLLPFAAALAIGLGWIVFGALPSQTPMRAEAGVAMAGQAKFLFWHPAWFPEVLLNTLWSNGVPHFKMFVGNLGWTDTALPPVYYPLAAYTLGLACVLAFFGRGHRLSGRWGLMLVATCVLAWAGVYGILYLTWTTVGADAVDGVQGRYFLPSATLLAVALPAMGSALARSAPPAVARAGRHFSRATWLVLFSMAAVSDLWLPRVVFARYFG
jgi:uncharacterized membrane protein